MILNIIPFFQTIYMSFSKTKAFGAYQFCGLENYLEMFRNAEFWKANWNSIYFCILTVPVGVFLALIVAVLLNAKIKGKTAFRACPWWWLLLRLQWSGSGSSMRSTAF